MEEMKQEMPMRNNFPVYGDGPHERGLVGLNCPAKSGFKIFV